MSVISVQHSTQFQVFQLTEHKAILTGLYLTRQN